LGYINDFYSPSFLWVKKATPEAPKTFNVLGARLFTQKCGKEKVNKPPIFSAALLNC